MIRQQFKNVYFGINRWLVLPNTLLCKFRYATPKDPEGHYVHLGSGENYIPGMINVEGYLARKRDAWLDLRNPLPFKDGSVFFLWCSHTLEHFYPDEALKMLKEIRRVMRPDGVARIATPSLEHALEIANGHQAEDPKRIFPDGHGQAIDYLFCDGQHKFAYSFTVMDRFARDCGFTRTENYSAANKTAPKKYGKIEVGNEYAGSLVAELRP